MHQELAAVVRGARKAGATDIVVNDSHWDMRNLRVELLEPGVTLVSGWQKPFSMVSGVNSAIGQGKQGQPFAAAFFVGYHARAGVGRAVLSHTYRAQVFLDVKLNGASVGETGLNAALAGWFGVPVAMITGDDACCAEAKELLGGVKCVTVKTAISRYSAAFRPQSDVLGELETAAYEALVDKNCWSLHKPKSPSTMAISMTDVAMADGAELLPYVKRLDDRTVEFTHDDYPILFKTMLAIGAIGASRKDPHF
jgi:D-amino peptidase